MVDNDDTNTRTSLLSDDWMEGVPLDRDLVRPVVIARQYLPNFQHGDAIRLWESFLDVAARWKQQHGFVETHSGEGGLLSPSPFSARKPWQCAGHEVQDPVDLLTEKLTGFESYERLEREHGRVAILAVVCLAHAAGAPNTHLQYTAYKAYGELRSREALVEGAKLTADVMRSDYKRGRGILENAREGHEAAHGTPEEKASRWQNLQCRLEQTLARNTQLSLTEARRRVAKQAGCSLKTVERHTTRP